MRIWSICLLIGVLCLGCNRAEEAVQDKSEQIGKDFENDPEASKSAVSAFSRIIAAETEYYTTGPQQGRPPDGKLPAGTKVNIVEEAGSYVLVRSEGGVEAYVAADAVQQQPLSSN